jgi:glutamine synthetase
MQAEILKKLEKDGIEFISLQFADLLGVVKEIIIPLSKLEDVLEHGLWFDGSSIEGFARIYESDLFLKPDLSTYSVIPWLAENGKTACFICDIYNHNGKPFERDARYILKKTISEIRKEGFEYNVGPEVEFYLFRKDDKTKTLPMDYGSYFDMTSHEGYRFIKEIIKSLKNFKINVETSHHEVGEGQYEIDFEYGPALQIADKLLMLKYTLKKIAQMYGLQATFMPKPIMNAPGSGMHVHQSLFDVKTGKNLFHDQEDKYKLSKIAYNFTAGQMKYIKEICAILCPTVNSYKRLISGFEAPVYITWGSMNRSSLIRVPKWSKEKSARIELRCPDSSCNPYLAFAVMLRAGFEGIKNNLMPPEPVEENVYKMEDSRLNEKNIDILPNSLWEALEELKSSKIVYETLGKSLFEKYIEIKTKEWNEFKMQVTAWEIKKYLEIY